MERIDYRPILEDLSRTFGSKKLLTITDVCAYTGVCNKTAKRRYGITKAGITTVALARKLAAL